MFLSLQLRLRLQVILALRCQRSLQQLVMGRLLRLHHRCRSRVLRTSWRRERYLRWRLLLVLCLRFKVVDVGNRGMCFVKHC